MTGSDAITSAFRLIGVLASGETPSASESMDALNTLIEMLDAWSLESLLIPNKVREVFPLVAGTQTYTMGVGGTFNTSNPLKIENALLQIPQTVGTTPLELPIQILNQDEQASISLKTLTSPLPLTMYADGAYPLELLTFWPVPNVSTNSVVLYSWKPLTTFSDLTTAVVFPPGYSRMIKHNLAVALAAEYGKGNKVPATVIQIADESKSNVKRMNTKPLYMRVDGALQGGNRGTWNWLTGEPQ